MVRSDGGTFNHWAGFWRSRIADRVEQMTIADRARTVGRLVHDAAFADVGSTINAGIAEVISWPFSVSSGLIVDVLGNSTECFACVVHTAKEGYAIGDDIPADSACAVVDVLDVMGLEEFRRSYGRVSAAKQLEKSPAPDAGKTPVATVTLTVIFARRLIAPLEVIAEELQQLNEGLPHSDWVDMVAISGVGVISYVCHFPGQSSLGAILPPAKGAIQSYSPAMYIIATMQASKDGTFNKVLAFIVSYTVFFSPGVAVPNFNDLLVGVCKNVVTMKGYQYNLAGDVVPVPREHYANRYLPPRPMLIEARGTKELLATLQYMPWQDGGTIVLKGKLPLEGLLVFLGKDALVKGGVMRTAPDSQVSYVLPITPADFAVMMTRIRNQSNMVVRQDVAKFTMEKMADEGTSTPFMARIYMGLLQIRQFAYPDEKERFAFDKTFDQTLSPLLAARAAARRIQETWKAHSEAIAAGELARVQGGTIHVDGDFGREFRKDVHAFLYDAARALKEGMQKTGNGTGRDIGFMFKKLSSYQTGLVALHAFDPILATYIQQTRDAWSERLIKARNDLDHNGWVLPRIAYEIRGVGVVAHQPVIDGLPAVEFVVLMMDRLSCFVEEFTVYCFQSRMPEGVTITQVPLANRPAEAPERFMLTLQEGGLPIWILSYAAARFEEI